LAPLAADVNEIIILRDDNAAFLIGYPHHLRILRAIALREVEGVPRIEALVKKPV